LSRIALPPITAKKEHDCGPLFSSRAARWAEDKEAELGLANSLINLDRSIRKISAGT
jgi:hypothetical protein